MTDDVVVIERPAPQPTAETMDRVAVTTYRDLCAEIGVVNPTIIMEDFRHFLNAADMPVFDLARVCAFMDDLTARTNPSKMGWEWRPVREADRIDLRFGRPATEDRSAGRAATMQIFADQMTREALRGFFGGASRRAAPPTIGIVQHTITPASDYYAGNDAKVYDRNIPAHALKKIAKVEKEFGGGKVVFMITDYVTLPHVVINPDPFLMAVVPNKDVVSGVGRFVIDVWDEPGFGIAQMLGA